MSIDYTSAGVNIDAGNEAVERIKKSVQSTFSSHVMTGLGGFGGAFDIHEATKDYTHPILVQSTDSVGTKVMIGKMMGQYESIGRDLVGNVVGDILAMGAKPLTFLDYLANDKTKPEIIEDIVRGIAVECKESDMSLIGGEIAEMPGVYQEGEIDVVGFVTGVVEKDKVITGKNISPGDVILGLASSGMHTNGFSLARKIFFEVGNHDVSTMLPELEKSVGETLLEPHINYTKPILGLLDSDVEIKGIAHITGGGLIENVPRILPNNCAAEIKKGSWPILPVFEVMQTIGSVKEQEMYRTFNMGIGMALVVSKDNAEKIKQKMKEYNKYTLYEIGNITEGEKTLKLI